MREGLYNEDLYELVCSSSSRSIVSICSLDKEGDESNRGVLSLDEEEGAADDDGDEIDEVMIRNNLWSSSGIEFMLPSPPLHRVR